MLFDPFSEEANAILALAERITAARAERGEVMSGEPIELMEVQMAERLGWTPGKLQKKRERLECEGLYRRVGRSIIYSAPLTLRAFAVRSPDNAL